MIRAVVFDLGNVLVLHDNAFLVQQLAQRVGCSPSEVEEKLDPKLWDRVHKGDVDGTGLRYELSARFGTSLEEDEFFRLWNCHFSVNAPMVALAEALAGKVQRLLLSNTNELHARHIRQALPLLGTFDHLLLSHEERLAKPDPAFYRRAQERAGLAPDEMVFFDDIPRYVEAARALGWHAYVFESASGFAAQLAGLGIHLPPVGQSGQN